MTFFIDFSNALMADKLQRLAQADTSNNVVNQLQEVFADFQVLNNDLFSLGIPSVLSLTKDYGKWYVPEQQLFNRMTEALYAVVMATRANAPIIRYQKSSDVCFRVAEKLNSKLREDAEFAQRMSKANM